MQKAAHSGKVGKPRKWENPGDLIVAMTKLSKRLEKLENIISPPQPKKNVRVIQKVGETQEQAIAKAGITDPEGSKIWIIRLIMPSTGNQRNEPRKYC